MAHHSTWKFDHLTQDYMTFIQAHDKPDTCIQGERQIFDYLEKRIPFYLECTPNGCSPQGIQKGECTMWFSIPLCDMPPDTAAIDVDCTIICQAVGYKQRSKYNALGLKAYSFPIGPPFISFDALRKQASWEIVCFVKITNIIPRNPALNNNIISQNHALSQSVFDWPFSGQLVTVFHAAQHNTDIHSNLFLVKGCAFGMECTPNGYGQDVPFGRCGIWVALKQLPVNIKAIENVQITVVCRELNYKSSLVVKTWTVYGNNYVSQFFPQFIASNQFNHLSSWTFSISFAEIGGFVPRENTSAISTTVALSNNANLASQQLQQISSQLVASQHSLVQKLVEDGVDLNDAMKIVSMSTNESSANKAIEFTEPAHSSLDNLVSLGFNSESAAIALEFCHQDVNRSVDFLVKQQLLLPSTSQVCDDLKSVEKCGYLEDLLSIMKQYDDSKDDTFDHIYSKFNCIQIIDIFHHLKHNHDNDDHFEYIYNLLPKCNIKHCYKFRRNYRNRRESTDSRLRPQHNKPPIQEILDKIHCYYKHAFDAAYRFTSDERKKARIESKEDDLCDDENDDDDDSGAINIEMQSLKSMLKEKKKNLALNTSINSVKDKFSELQNAYGKLDGSMYKFGDPIYYYNMAHVKANVSPNYSNLKDEMINNIICSINKSTFDKVYAKAEYHRNSEFCKKTYFRIKCPFTQKIIDITTEHLLSVMIYCNYDYLQHEFSKTFRENRAKHTYYYHLGKYITEAVNIFGDQGTTTAKTFYHGINNQLMFPVIVGRYESIQIYGPLSTTESYPVALNFATGHGNNGIIVEFGSPPLSYTEGGWSCKEFPCEWISDFVGEQEHLYIQNHAGLSINNIINVALSCHLKRIVDGCKAINRVIQTSIKLEHDADCMINAYVLKIVRHQLWKHHCVLSVSEEWKWLKTHRYAAKLIDMYCSNVTIAEIDFEEKKYKKFTQLFYDEEYKKCSIYLLEYMFPNMRHLILKNVNVNEKLVEDVMRTLQNKTTPLKVIQIHPDKVSEHNTQMVIQKYSEHFERFNYEIKAQDGFLSFASPDFNHSTCSTRGVFYCEEEEEKDDDDGDKFSDDDVGGDRQTSDRTSRGEICNVEMSSTPDIYSKPQSVHIVHNDLNERDASTHAADDDYKYEMIPSEPIDPCSILDNELQDIMDLIKTNREIDLEIESLTDKLREYETASAGFNNHITRCSNRSDNNYNGNICNRTTLFQRHSVHHNSDKNSDDDNSDDDNKENDDRDDEKESEDGIKHHTQLRSCDHLKTCPECTDIDTRKDEHIKLLYGLVHRLQQQHEYHTICEDMFCKVISNRSGNNNQSNKNRKKRKPKPLQTIIDGAADGAMKYELYPNYRAKKNIKISRKLTQDVIPKTYNKSISNMFSYVEKSIGMQYNDKQIVDDTNTKYQILNLDVCDEKTSKSLYLIMERMPTANKNFKWQMKDELFTANEINSNHLAVILPQSSRITLQKMSTIYDIKQFAFDEKSIKNIMKQCKWNTVAVIKKKNNKKRLTLSITQEELNPIVSRSLLNIHENKNCFIPIVMFGHNSHWVEYVLLVHVQKDIVIGIALRYNAKIRNVQITGIHLDKQMILEQHELLLSHDHRECHCLGSFVSIINDMRVGNCDSLQNQIKHYKQKYHVFKSLAFKITNGKDTEKYETLRNHANALLKYNNGSLRYCLDNKNISSSSPNSISPSNSYGLCSPDNTSVSSHHDNHAFGLCK